MKTASLGLLKVMVLRVNAGGSLLLFTNSAVEDTTSSSAGLVAVVLAVVFTEAIRSRFMLSRRFVPGSGDPGAIPSRFI